VVPDRVPESDEAREGVCENVSGNDGVEVRVRSCSLRDADTRGWLLR